MSNLPRKKLFPPFPYYGGKRRVAAQVWARFGEVGKYFEPFAGALSVLLQNPYKLPECEYITDKNGFVVNAWRSLQKDINGVYNELIQMTSEARLSAINYKLKNLNPQLFEDIDYYDSKVAGWWIYKMQVSIDLSPTNFTSHSLSYTIKNRNKITLEYLKKIQNRLRNVCVYNQNWDYILNPLYLELNKSTSNTKPRGVFLDPPYIGFEDVYEKKSDALALEVEKWAIENEHPLMKICLAGHEGDYKILEAKEDWKKVFWTRHQKGKQKKEVLIFSPACQSQEQPILFS